MFHHFQWLLNRKQTRTELLFWVDSGRSRMADVGQEQSFEICPLSRCPLPAPSLLVRCTLSYSDKVQRKTHFLSPEIKTRPSHFVLLCVASEVHLKNTVWTRLGDNLQRLSRLRRAPLRVRFTLLVRRLDSSLGAAHTAIPQKCAGAVNENSSRDGTDSSVGRGDLYGARPRRKN